MKSILEEYWEDESGVTTIEYVLLLALVAVAAIVAFSTLLDATGLENSTNTIDDLGSSEDPQGSGMVPRPK